MNKNISENLHNIAFVGIEVKLDNGQSGYSIRGTGLLLKNNRLITCAHVYNAIPHNMREKISCGIQESDTADVKKYSTFLLKLLDKNDERDIALFEVENFPTTYGVERSIFASTDDVGKLEITQELHLAGFPLANELLNMGMGITLIASNCVLGSKKYRNVDNKLDFLLIDKSINPGSSGSPVFCGNKVIGLASANINQTHDVGGKLINVPIGVGVVRTSGYILELIDEFEKGQSAND